jgi:isopropylmalate/homocitrate/citramalate synthase
VRFGSAGKQSLHSAAAASIPDRAAMMQPSKSGERRSIVLKSSSAKAVKKRSLSS